MKSKHMPLQVALCAAVVTGLIVSPGRLWAQTPPACYTAPARRVVGTPVDPFGIIW